MRLGVIPWAGSERPREEELRRRLEGEGFAVFCWSDPPNAHYEPHAHDHDESIWLVAGAVTFGVDGRTLSLRAGDRLMLPADTVHTADAGRDGATYLIGER